MTDAEKNSINQTLIGHIRDEWKKGKITGTIQDPPVFIYSGKSESGEPSIMQVNFFMVKISYPRFSSSLYKSLAADKHFGCIDKTIVDADGNPRLVIIRKELCK